MSQADIETLRSAYDALSRGDWDGVLRVAHPDMELKAPDRHPLAGTYHGAGEVRRFFEEWFDPFEEVVAEPERFFVAGDRIVVFVLSLVRPKGSTATFEIRFAQLWTMRDGKAARCEMFPERQEALEAVGLSE
jgi:ketosteroid isomerase-like protein